MVGGYNSSNTCALAALAESRGVRTYHIEDALQRMEQVKDIRMSVSRPGVSDILVEFQDRYRADDFPDILDELRRKIADAGKNLPPGARTPMIIDDFGDVYGV